MSPKKAKMPPKADTRAFSELGGVGVRKGKKNPAATIPRPAAMPSFGESLPLANNFSSFEDYRASLLNKIYSQVDPLLADGGKLRALFPKVSAVLRRRRFKGRKIQLSQASFYRTFRDWEKAPSAETLKRRWSSGGRKISLLTLEAIAALALQQERSIAEIVRNLPHKPCSARTVTRAINGFKKLTELARLSRKKVEILRSFGK